MGTSQRFSKEFKEAIVKKLLNRGNQTIEEFCDANNIARSTLTTWQTNCANVSEMKNKKKATIIDKALVCTKTNNNTKKKCIH